MDERAQICEQGVPTVSRSRAAAGAAIFIITLLAGLAVVKWGPLAAKAGSAAVHHTLGSSILSGHDAAPTVAGWPAAVQYALAYYSAIWKALVLALVAAATLQVFMPRSWIHRLLGDTGFRSTAIAGTLSLIGMM